MKHLFNLAVGILLTGFIFAAGVVIGIKIIMFQLKREDK
jgi:hypothetical protein